MFYWNDISAKTDIGTIRINKAYRKHYTQKTLLYVEVNSELIQTSKMKIFALMQLKDSIKWTKGFNKNI